MKDKDWDKIDNYFFIIQTIADRAGDEYADAIKQVCEDAMAFTWKLQKGDKEE